MENNEIKETEALKRGREFRENFNKDHEKVSSGFWLSTAQLRELADELEHQESGGIGFMVGCRNFKNKKGIEIITKRRKIFSVEIVPLKNFDINNHQFKEVHLKGNIKNSELAQLVCHINREASEIQRFPPPEL